MKEEKKFNLVVLVVALLLYSTNRFTSLFTAIPQIGKMFRNHFNDFLGAIVFIAYVNILLAGTKRRTYKTFPWMLFWGSVCSLMWEGIAPVFLSYSTADWWDCVAYCLGMLTYWKLIKIFISNSEKAGNDPSLS